MDREASRREFFEKMRRSLESAFLASEDPRAQSGFRGDAARWERARRVIVEAIDRSGTLLDIGCANGHLMGCIVEWTSMRGVHIEPYGLDLSVAVARRRLPRWSDRIFIGNTLDWTPPTRFDLVRTELAYVPEFDRLEFVKQLLTEFLSPSGRLVIAAYGGRHQPPEDPSVALSGAGFAVHGHAESRDLDGTLLTRIAWVDACLVRAGGAC